MTRPEPEEDPGNILPLHGHVARRWYHLRKSDVLFLVGLGIISLMFAKWYETGTSPDPYWLGTAIWLTTGSLTLPRVLTWFFGD